MYQVFEATKDYINWIFAIRNSDTTYRILASFFCQFTLLGANTWGDMNDACIFVAFSHNIQTI